MENRERAEVVCMNCGRTLAQVERRDDRLRLVDVRAQGLLRIVEGRMFCARCGGRGFVDGRMLVA